MATPRASVNPSTALKVGALPAGQGPDSPKPDSLKPARFQFASKRPRGEASASAPKRSKPSEEYLRALAITSGDTLRVEIKRALNGTAETFVASFDSTYVNVTHADAGHLHFRSPLGLSEFHLCAAAKRHTLNGVQICANEFETILAALERFRANKKPE